MTNTTVKRELLTAFGEGVRWLLNPVSADGAMYAARFTLHLTGPEHYQMRDNMRQHPTGKRLLAERPDLGATLDDLDGLAKMNKGTVGRAYYEIMQHEEAVPGYILNGLVHRDNFLAKLGWDEEVTWLGERLLSTHDLLHILTGYGPDLAGEAMLIWFNLGHWNVPKAIARISPFGIGARILRPAMGWRRWHQRLDEAYERGRKAAEVMPYYCIPHEEMLSMKVEEARELIGMPPMPESHHNTEGWLKDSFADAAANGFGQYELNKRVMQVVRGLVEKEGVPSKTVLTALSVEEFGSLMKEAKRGATPTQMRDWIVAKLPAGSVAAA